MISKDTITPQESGQYVYYLVFLEKVEIFLPKTKRRLRLN